MSERTIRLPESLYLKLVAAAEEKGLTPASWIDSQLSTTVDESIAPQLAFEFPEDLIGSVDSRDKVPAPSAELPEDLIGSFNSKTQSLQGRPVSKDDAFGQYVVKKMKKQGIHLP